MVLGERGQRENKSSCASHHHHSPLPPLSPPPQAKTRGVLYTVDASSPETVGAATIYLVDLLSQPGLDLAQVMVVFTKTDLPSARSLPEIRALMRMDQICSNSKQIVRYSKIFAAMNFTMCSKLLRTVVS